MTRNVTSISSNDMKYKVVAEEEWPACNQPRFIEMDVWKRANYYSCTRKVLKYLEGSFDKPIRLPKMAAIACMEKTTFSRAFRQRTGITFHEFVQAYRISQAVARMETSDCSITEVAFNTGFSNLDTFARVFKKIARTTPSQYRLEIRRRNGLMVNTPMEAAS